MTSICYRNNVDGTVSDWLARPLHSAEVQGEDKRIRKWMAGIKV